MKLKDPLTSDQQRQLEKLWFIYGNHGPKSTMPDHKFIQGFLEHGEDLREFYKPSKEVIEKVDLILRKEEPHES